jgi:hypothetical protein
MRLSVPALLATIVLLVVSLTIAPAATAAPEDEDKETWHAFTAEGHDACGEPVLVTGTQHVIERITEDGTGRLHISFTRHTQGTGIGTESGEEYLLIDSVVRSQHIISNDGETTVLTEGVQTLFIHKGESANDDLIVHLVTETTITPDGETTTVVRIKSVECR